MSISSELFFREIKHYQMTDKQLISHLKFWDQIYFIYVCTRNQKKASAKFQLSLKKMINKNLVNTVDPFL